MRVEADFWACYEQNPKTGCWLWTRRLKAGYGIVEFRGKRWAAHRLAFTLNCRLRIPDGLLVCHRCDVPACGNPGHLFLGTHTQNMRDMAQKGRAGGCAITPKYGEENPSAKLTWDLVREIRTSTHSKRAMSRHYGVSLSQIKRICRGERWKESA